MEAIHVSNKQTVGAQGTVNTELAPQQALERLQEIASTATSPQVLVPTALLKDVAGALQQLMQRVSVLDESQAVLHAQIEAAAANSVKKGWSVQMSMGRNIERYGAALREEAGKLGLEYSINVGVANSVDVEVKGPRDAVERFQSTMSRWADSSMF